jgi:hypothetical protein
MTLDAARGSIDTGTGPVSRVEATLNAADAVIDLGAADTGETSTLQLTLNASDGRLVLPDGPLRGSVTLNASSLEICVPASTAVEIELTETLSSNDLGGSGLDEVRDSTWTTPGFSGSADPISLELTSTVSSLSLERPEACS